MAEQAVQHVKQRGREASGAPKPAGAGTSLRFTEQMKGFVGRGQTTFERGYEAGERAGTRLVFELTIRVEDVERFCKDPDHEAPAEGWVECELFGGRRPVEMGRFNLFVESVGDTNRTLMRYRLFFTDANGSPFTLTGKKDVHDDVGPDAWRDTTTLFVYILRGHVAAADEPRSEIVAAGIIRIEPLDFLRQLASFRTFGATAAARTGALVDFGRYFLRSLWDTYGPSALVPAAAPFEREIPLWTTEGVPDAEITTHPFVTGDELGLSVTRFHRRPCADVVVVIHGLTTSTDMFIMPEHENLVRYLLDHDFTDVWTVDFRMSNRFPYNLQRHRFTMDDIALYDFPAAIAEIRRHVGDDVGIHVICHCLGSVSFMMSLFGRAVTNIQSVVANSVALTPRVPGWSRFKLSWAPFLTEYILGVPYLNPRWSEEPGLTVGKIFTRVNSLFHRECDVPACHMLSLMWGSGWPALYHHENLADVTHRRGGDLYGGTSVHYYRHVRRMVEANNTAVKYDPDDPRHRPLPDDYFQYAKDIETPVLFMTGGENHVFTDSNVLCHTRLQQIVPGRHTLKVFAGYGHQDVFMGQHCARDIFPTLVRFMRRHAKEQRVRAAASVVA